jgi:hypothetical protein
MIDVSHHRNSLDWQLTPPANTNQGLSGALSGPDSSVLRRRTVWFCRRVWLLDCRSYSNKKESIFSVPVNNWNLCPWSVACSIPGRCGFWIRWAAAIHEIVLKVSRTLLSCFAELKKHVEPCRAKKHVTRKTGAGQRSMGGGVFSVSQPNGQQLDHSKIYWQTWKLSTDRWRAGIC